MFLENTLSCIFFGTLGKGQWKGKGVPDIWSVRSAIVGNEIVGSVISGSVIVGNANVGNAIAGNVNRRNYYLCGTHRPLHSK